MTDLVKLIAPDLESLKLAGLVKAAAAELYRDLTGSTTASSLERAAATFARLEVEVAKLGPRLVGADDLNVPQFPQARRAS